MRIIVFGGAFFVIAALLGVVLNQTIGYLLHPYVVFGSIPAGIIVGFMSQKWLKTPQWIKNQMVETED